MDDPEENRVVFAWSESKVLKLIEIIRKEAPKDK